MSLEEIMSELARFGLPRLSKMKEGWYCVMDVFVTGSGVEFAIKSEFRHQTVYSAAAECLDRMRAAMSDIKKALPA